jgi:hypothetical protein
LDELVDFIKVAVENWAGLMTLSMTGDRWMAFPWGCPKRQKPQDLSRFYIGS